MRIALSFPGCHRRAGVERVVYEAAVFLHGRGHDVHVIAAEWGDEPRPFHEVGVRPPRVPGPLGGAVAGPAFQRVATRALAALDADVHSGHGAVCPLGGVPFTQSIHAAWLERARRFRSPHSKEALRQRLNPAHPVLLTMERRFYAEGAYDQIVVTTPAVAGDLEEHYGVPPDRCVVVPNGFNPAEFSPERRLERRAARRRDLGYGADDVVLLFVGNELDRKGWDVVLAALRGADRRLRVLMVGRPHAEAAARAAAAGVADRVRCEPPTADVAAMHAAADAFVLPTQYEAFCLAILEALGSGLPVITTRVPGADDAIRDGGNGLLMADPQDADELRPLLDRIADDDVRAAFTARAAPSVAAHRWPEVLPAYEAVLLAHARRR